jgi:hypothetical protein
MEINNPRVPNTGGSSNQKRQRNNLLPRCKVVIGEMKKPKKVADEIGAIPLSFDIVI